MNYGCTVKPESLNDIQRAYNNMPGNDISIISVTKNNAYNCSFGCFAKDQHGRTFAVTAEHLFTDKMKAPSLPQSLPGLFHFCNMLSKDSCHEFRTRYGILDKVKVDHLNPNLKVVVDIAIVLLCDKNTLPNLCFTKMEQISIFSPPTEQDDLDGVDDEGDDEADSENDWEDELEQENHGIVEKYGYTTGYTRGKVIRVSSSRGRTFIVAFVQNNKDGVYSVDHHKKFADKGDSGALVKLVTGNSSQGFGIVHKVWENVTIGNDITKTKYKYVTGCVRLDFCVKAINQKFGLELKLFDGYVKSSQDGRLCTNTERRRLKSE